MKWCLASFGGFYMFTVSQHAVAVLIVWILFTRPTWHNIFIIFNEFTYIVYLFLCINVYVACVKNMSLTAILHCNKIRLATHVCCIRFQDLQVVGIRLWIVVLKVSGVVRMHEHFIIYSINLYRPTFNIICMSGFSPYVIFKRIFDIV